MTLPRILLPACVFLPCLLQAELPQAVKPDNPALAYSGRRDDSSHGRVSFSHSGGRVRLAFRGDAVGAWIDSGKPNFLNVFVDGRRMAKLEVRGQGKYYELASGLSPGPHTIEIVKATEGLVGPVDFRGFALPDSATIFPWPRKELRRIEFIGDSITCGYGIDVTDPKLSFDPATENFCETYAWRAARALGADYLVVACSGIGMVKNFGGPPEGSPENMTVIYDRTLFHDPGLVWNPKRFVPDVVCLNLGTNDFSEPSVKPDLYAAHYKDFLRKLIGRYPSARFVLLYGPMNNDPKLGEILEQVAEELNLQHPGKASVFQLSAQGGRGFGADFHPSRRQAEANGNELAVYLSKLMRWPLQEAP